MFFRSILHDLEKWKTAKKRKPLILRGARQVGKTTAIEIFSKKFDNYIPLNLELYEDRNIFREELSINELFQAILLMKNIVPNKGSTLLFIDEIQNSAVAVKMLRYFYEKKPEIFIIAAGSLLEVMLEQHSISFPVGRVEFQYLYPLSFKEFLMAKQEEQALEEYNTVPLKTFAHQKLLNLFQEYTLVGGMPEAVKGYIESSGITSLKSIYESLLISYINDSEKYARNTTMKQVLRHCLETIAPQAGSRIKFQGFGKSSYKSREIGEALRVLERAMLIYLIYPTTSVKLPLTPDYRKSPRLQYLDTGLLNYFAGIQHNYFKHNHLFDFYRGLVVEHIVYQELICSEKTSIRKPLFWVKEKRQSNAEVDVVLPHDNLCIPVEIKSGKSGTLRSLHQFINMAPHGFGIRLYEGEFNIENSSTVEGKRFKLLNLPYFLAGNIPAYISKYC